MQRFRVGFSRIPAMRAVGQMYNEDAGKALVEAKLQGETIARELSSFGIDLCFAPVLDIDHGLSQIIGDRAFSDRGDVIVELARAFRAGQNGRAAFRERVGQYGWFSVGAVSLKKKKK